MNVIGIDPSLSCTGWAMMDGQKLLTWGHIKTKPGNHGRQLVQIQHEITQVLIGHDGEVALEWPYYAKNIKTTITLGEVRGIILAVCEHCGITPASYSPSEVKQAVGCKGNASKQQVGQMVRALTGAEGLTEDESDAVAVAMCHASRMRGNNNAS